LVDISGGGGFDCGMALIQFSDSRAKAIIATR
jgi:hypothetical protein